MFDLRERLGREVEPHVGVDPRLRSLDRPKRLMVTKQLVEAGKLMGIPVHDHIIIAGRGYTSLAERGLM